MPAAALRFSPPGGESDRSDRISTMAERPTFDDRAFEGLPEGPDFVRSLRKAAFEEFRSLPIPSQETEEWRYTDLSSFDLRFGSGPPRHTLTTSNQPLGGTG